MFHRAQRVLLLPLLAACMCFAASSPVLAQGGTSASLQINFGVQPHWASIQGTRVREFRSVEYPDYDVYRYGGMYYIFSNERWYSSRTGRGQFVVIEEREVPMEFSRIPREHWRHYPTAWVGDSRHDNGRRGNGRDHGRGNGRGNGRDHDRDDDQHKDHDHH